MRGGDKETELNELQVSPMLRPLAVCVVIIATPVGKLPSAFRNAR